ncbi:hypothetical protein EX30DRAFT_148483 [Ascodesmis nigricans]|uniref:Uncharacterized protein n=1 Tax=Ascodesmis nigricans TaxID=341454 RepID=A0A4S2N1U2_9PEZI|nr:hypothetical protein EX30DRAFT_148483 [Ascodesmis nigricans]
MAFGGGGLVRPRRIVYRAIWIGGQLMIPAWSLGGLWCSGNASGKTVSIYRYIHYMGTGRCRGIGLVDGKGICRAMMI